MSTLPSGLPSSGLPPAGSLYSGGSSSLSPSSQTTNTTRAQGSLSTDPATAAVAASALKVTIEPDDTTTKPPVAPAHKVTDIQTQLKGLWLSDANLINHYLKNCGKQEILALKSSGIASKILGLMAGAAAIGLCVIFPPAAIAGVIMGGYLYLGSKQEEAHNEPLRRQEMENRQIAKSVEVVSKRVEVFSQALTGPDAKEFQDFLKELGFPDSYTWTHEDVQFVAEEALPRFKQFQKDKAENKAAIDFLDAEKDLNFKKNFLLRLPVYLQPHQPVGTTTLVVFNISQIDKLIFEMEKAKKDPTRAQEFSLIDYELRILKHLKSIGEKASTADSYLRQANSYLDQLHQNLDIVGSQYNKAQKIAGEWPPKEKAMKDWIAANKQAAPATPAAAATPASPAAAVAPVKPATAAATPPVVSAVTIDLDDDTKAPPVAAATPITSSGTFTSSPPPLPSVIPGLNGSVVPPKPPSLPPLPGSSSSIDLSPTPVTSPAAEPVVNNPPQPPATPLADGRDPNYPLSDMPVPKAPNLSYPSSGPLPMPPLPPNK